MTASTNDHWIELLKQLYDEWKFRQEELWKKATQLLVIIFFTSTLPLTASVIWDKVKVERIPLCAFPVAGIFLTAFFLVFFLSNSLRINALDKKRKRVIGRIYGKEYSRFDLPPLFDKEANRGASGKRRACFIFRWRMSIWVPFVLSALEVLVAVAMICMICNGIITHIAG